jgi:predicted protein tyrosine phosphatase
MRILFLCEVGKNRSIVGAEILGELAGLDAKLDIDSAGFADFGSKKGKEIESMLKSYDDIYVMDRKSENKLKYRYRVDKRRVHNLQILDDYDINLPKERENLEIRMRNVLERYSKRYK